MLLTDVPLDPQRLAIFAPCMDSYGVGSASAEWPNNMLSTRTVAYASGRLARRGEAVRHAVDPRELAFCRERSLAIEKVMQGVEVGMGSEGGTSFHAFFVAANADEPVPARIDGALIERAFGGTLFPLATITVEALAQRGVWWSEVQANGEESPASYFAPWRAMIDWFEAETRFVDTAFVRIGDRRALWDVEADRNRLPPGTEVTPCTLPRMPIGLTDAGSLVGLFGYSVQT